MITGPQLRAARALLDWNRDEVAEYAKISPETVKNIEKGTFRPQLETVEKIYKAFAQHDVEFMENQGVRIRKELVRTFVGENGFREYLDHVYSTVSVMAPVTRHFNFSDTNITNFAGKFLAEHNKRMSEIAGLDAKCLVPFGDSNFPAKYCQYRWLKKEYSTSLPYYIYGDYVLFFMQKEPELMFVSICSKNLADSLKSQFDVLWEQGIIPK